jgi:serine/threonine-protein kinase
MIGKTLGKYRIVEKLGRGGMGVVYKGIDETLDREVAIKLFSAEVGEEQDIVKRFRAEATTLARLNHPEIATIYELYRHESDLLMVMEYVSGETLERLSQRSGPLPPERAAYLVAQVLGALQYAHQAGIVHRDLKPANVMVNDQGHVKVMDFGIARVLGAEHMTRDGHMMGTPAYMAPEQVLGQDVDARADLYSVGVVFYRLLSGTLPFRADTVIGMVQKQVSDQPTPVRVHRADIPEWCETVLARALAKKPEDRFQTAEEFRQALLAPVNALSAERTMPLAVDLTTHPASLASPGPAARTSAVVVPTSTVAAATAAVGAVSVADLVALTKRYRLAIGGGALALLALFVVLLSLSHGSPPAAPGAGAPAPAPTPPLPSTAQTGTHELPMAVPELRRPSSNTSTPAATAPAGSQPGAPPSSSPLDARTVAPADAGRVANAAPFSFGAKAVVRDGTKQREQDAKVLMSGGVITVTVRFDRSSETVLSTIPFRSLTSVSYSKGKQPQYTTSGGAKQALRIDAAIGFFKGDRHWVSLRTNDTFVVLRVDGDDINSVLAAIEERTGRTVERIVDRKDNK